MQAQLATGDHRGHGVGRLFVVIALAGVLLLAAGVFLAAVGLVDAEPWLPADGDLLESLGLAKAPPALGRALVALVAVAAGLLSIWLMGFRGGMAPAQESTYVLASDEKGLVTVELAGIQTIASAAVLRTPGVVEAQLTVQSRGGGPVRMRMVASVIAGADLQEVGARARSAASEAVERLVGIDVGDVSVQLRVVPPDRYTRIVR